MPDPVSAAVSKQALLGLCRSCLVSVEHAAELEGFVAANSVALHNYFVEPVVAGEVVAEAVVSNDRAARRSSGCSGRTASVALEGALEVDWRDLGQVMRLEFLAVSVAILLELEVLVEVLAALAHCAAAAAASIARAVPSQRYLVRRLGSRIV